MALVLTLKARLLQDMMSAVNGVNGNKSRRKQQHGRQCRVLVLDDVTMSIVGGLCDVSDLEVKGVPAFRRIGGAPREGETHYEEAIYFLQPTEENLNSIIQDLGGRRPRYSCGYVFLSSPATPELVQRLRSSQAVRARLGALAEMNLELWHRGDHGFVTDQPLLAATLVNGGAPPRHRGCPQRSFLVDMFGTEASTVDMEGSIQECARRLATLFASLKENPTVRFQQVPWLVGRGCTAEAEADLFANPDCPRVRGPLAPTKLACSLLRHMDRLKGTVPGFPAHDTCDLLILSRSIDGLEPLLRDWTYEGACADALGQTELCHVDESEGQDWLWRELRDLPLPEALQRLNEAQRKVQEEHEQIAAALQQCTEDGWGAGAGGLVPECMEHAEKKEMVMAHVNRAAELMERVQGERLLEVGAAEQRILSGTPDALTWQELLKALAMEGLTSEAKLRLVMVYAAMGGALVDLDALVWRGMTPRELTATFHLDILGVSVQPQSAEPKQPKAAMPKSSPGATLLQRMWSWNSRPEAEEATDQEEDEGSLYDLQGGSKGAVAWRRTAMARAREPGSSLAQLSVSEPFVKKVISDLHLGELPQEFFPSLHEAEASSGEESGDVESMQECRKSPRKLWGRSDARVCPEPVVRPLAHPRRLIVFILGGMTVSELRAARELSHELKREVIIGSTSLLTPGEFLHQVTQLRPLPECV